MPRDRARELGVSAVQIARRGWYLHEEARVEIAPMVEASVAGKRSLPPEQHLDAPAPPAFSETHVQVVNETTMQAGKRLIAGGRRPLALNFANGIQPGGGFLNGARAQEETLCRSSALYLSLEDDPMYAVHAERPRPDSTDWAIFSPSVPFFRSDDGSELPEPWCLDILTCAAPYAPGVGWDESAELLRLRILRVLAIAQSMAFDSMVLGAWGCGAFHNDPATVALDFRTALVGDFSGAFDHVVFAITDWSVDRRYLSPFREVFS